MLFFSQSVIIDFLVYFGYIKDIFGEDDEENNDDGLSIKLQVINKIQNTSNAQNYFAVNQLFYFFRISF